MNSGSEKLYQELARIAEKSREGEIAWSQPNPSTYIWQPDEHDKIMSVQKAENANVKGLRKALEQFELHQDVYLFQVRDSTKKITILSLSSRERPEFYDVLKEIYNSAVEGRDAVAGKFLEGILGPR
jgi:hypothetical protein